MLPGTRGVQSSASLSKSWLAFLSRPPRLLAMTEIEFGLDTFGDMSLDDNGNPKSAGQVLRDVVEQA